MDFQIDIDGMIGEWGYSKQYVRRVLEENKGREVNVRINSLGGSLDDALDIAARFNEHGQVNCYMYGYCASAATVMALGARKTIIDANAFYLVHKVSNWVEVWGTLNADQMQETIEELEKNKRDNEKMDLVLARMYAKKTGKDVNDILDILKAGAWLTAADAKELGFVDEMTEGLTYNTSIEAKLNALGLPLPTPQKKEPKTFVQTVKDLLTNNKFQTMLSNYLNLNALLKVDGFEEGKENSVQMTADQLTAIDNQLKANSAEIEAMKAEIEAKENTIEELTAKVAALENQPGASTQPVEPQVNNVEAADLFNLVKHLI